MDLEDLTEEDGPECIAKNVKEGSEDPVLYGSLIRGWLLD